MAKGEWTALIIAAEVILVALVLGVVMLLLLRRSRQWIARLQAQIDLLSRRQAGHFLERELVNTREMAKRAAPDDERLKLLTKVRLHWLQLELQALQEEGGSKSDTAQLERSSRALLALIGTPTASETPTRHPAAPAQGEQRSDDALKQARAVISLQKEVISRLKEQLVATPKVDGETERDGFSTATLDQVSANTDVQLVSVEKLEEELKAARVSYQRVSDELARLHGQTRERSTDSASGGLLVVNRGDEGAGVDVTAARTLLGNMQTAYDESTTELRRMRDTNVRQRELILGMEQELAQMRKDSGETEASQALLDNLKRQLRDYENCTVILEMESDNLRARIGTLNSIIDTAEGGGAIDTVENQQPDRSEVEALRLRSRLFTAALKRLADLANAPSMERAIELLSSGFGDRRLGFVLMIKGVNKQYWFSSDGESVDSRVRHLLLSVVPSTESPWTHVKGGAMYGGSTMRLYMESGSYGAEPFERYCQFLVPQLQVINTLVAMIDLRGSQPQQQRANDNLLEQAGRQLMAIDEQCAQLSEEGARIGTNLQSELESYFASLALTDIQRHCIESMLADFRAEMALLTTTSKTISNNLRSAIQSLDAGRESKS